MKVREIKANMIDYVELNREKFNNSFIKNRYIASTEGEFIAFLDSSATNAEEVKEILDNYDFLHEYDAVVFSDRINEGETDLVSVLCSFEAEIYGFVFKRSILEYTGCFNELLDVGNNYEFLCRLSQNARVFCLSCNGEENNTVFSSRTMAYICRRYLPIFEKEQQSIFIEGIIEKMNTVGQAGDFLSELNAFLSDNCVYEKLARNTAPIVVISGNNICNGVLKDFAESLAKEFIKLGQAVILVKLNCEFQDFNILLKGAVGFQCPDLENEYWRNLSVKKFQFVFDNPFFFENIFRNLDDSYYVLCQDGQYTNWFKDYFGVKNARWFFPAGKTVEFESDCERPYDIVFIGAYTPILECFLEEPLCKKIFEYIIQNPDYTFLDGFEKVLQMENIVLEKEDLINTMNALKYVFNNVNAYYRKLVMDILIENGFNVHVYGDSWKEYMYFNRDNLVIHPAVSVDEAMEELKKAKIGLNVMRWHKAGMTERVANIMMSGAVCLSDETLYLNSNFTESEEIAIFRLCELDKLPDKVAGLLKDEKLRKKIAANAYNKVIKEHTWRKRAENLLELMDE